MRYSFSTLACPAWTLSRVIDAAASLGYDGIELRFLEGDDGLWRRGELTGAGLAETRARLTDAGVQVACVDSRSFLHHPDPAARRAAVDDASRMAELAAALGAPGVRLFGDRVQAGADLASTRGWIIDGLRDLRDLARPMGVEIWLETHGDFAPGEAARSVLDAVGEGVGAIWDPANAFSEFGETPEVGAHALGAAIRHVHLKDVKRPAPPAPPFPWMPTLLGEGEFPAERVLAILTARGYDRFVSFEWEKRWHPEIPEPEVALPHFLRWARSDR
jgi:sugar phosphate isomerase/epimerase